MDARGRFGERDATGWRDIKVERLKARKRTVDDPRQVIVCWVVNRPIGEQALPRGFPGQRGCRPDQLLSFTFAHG